MSDQSPRPEPPAAQEGSAVQQPAKVLRFGSMVAATLNEVRQVSLDEEGLQRLSEAYQRTLEGLRDLLSEDLREELDEEVELPSGDGTFSQEELRVAQARLVGWLEGLFRGLQASAVDRQMAAQLEAARRGETARGEDGEEVSLPGYL